MFSVKMQYIDFGINLIEMFASIINTLKNIWNQNKKAGRNQVFKISDTRLWKRKQCLLSSLLGIILCSLQRAEGLSVR